MTVVQEKLAEYKHIYEQLKEKLRWKINDKRTLMIVASMYVVNDKPFHFPQFRAESICESAGWFLLTAEIVFTFYNSSYA
ncbi:hypothetical protein ACFQDF_05850 [Ectobacillus funiculus]